MLPSTGPTPFNRLDVLLGVVDQVLLVDRTVVERAKQIALGNRRLSAPDAIHLAIMEQHGIEIILTFDWSLTIKRGSPREEEF